MVNCNNSKRIIFFEIHFILLFLVIIGNVAKAQTCASPTPISIGTPLTNLTTCFMENNFDQEDACGNTYMNGPEHVFSFTPTTLLETCVSIEVNGLTSNSLSMGLFAFDGCPDNPATKCMGQSVSTLGKTNLDGLNLTINKTYYFVTSSPANCFNFNITLKSGNCAPTLPGTNCSNPAKITTVPFSSPGLNNCGFLNDYNEGNTTCYGPFINSEDYVFEYIPTQSTCVNITATGSIWNAGIYAFKGCPTDPNSICMGMNWGNLQMTSISVNNLEVGAGKSYYFVVSTNPTLGPCTEFNFDVTESVCNQIGSSCYYSQTIPALPFTETGKTTCGFRNSYKNQYNFCPTITRSGQDYFYSYTPSVTQCVNIALSGTSTNSSISVIDGCPDEYTTNCIGISTVQKDPSLLVSLIAGKTYFIIVDHASACTPFNIDIIVPPAGSIPGSTCANPYTISSVPFKELNFNTNCMGADYNPTSTCAGPAMGGEDFVFKYSPTVSKYVNVKLGNAISGTGLYVFDNCPDNPVANCLGANYDNDHYVCNVYFEVGKTYYIVVDHNFSATPFDIEIEEAETIGLNCTNPIIVPGLPYLREALSSKCFLNDFSLNASCGGVAMNGEDVVYTYTPVSNEVINVILSDTKDKSGIFILDKCPSDLSANCLQAARGQNPSLCQVSLSAGTTYYIVVDRELSFTEYNIKIESIDPRGVNCSNPYPISSLPFSKKYTSTKCFINNYTTNEICNSPGINIMYGEDFVFEYTVTASQSINIKVSNSDGTVGLYVLNACPGITSSNCVASVIGTNPSLCNVLLPSAGTYYIMVDRTTGSTNFDITVKPSSEPGVNCSNSYPINSIPFVKSGLTTLCYGNDYNQGQTCSNSYMAGNDFVFKLNLTTQECLRIACDIIGRGGMTLTKGCPDDPTSTCIGMSNNDTYLGKKLIIDANLTPGLYYLIVSSSDVLGNANVDFDISVKNALFDATITYDLPYFCTKHAAAMLSAADPGGVWSGTGITDATKGIFDPAVAGDGLHKIKYKLTGSLCAAAVSDSILIAVDDSLCDISYCNFGFSRGNFDQWQGFTGTCCPVNASDTGIVTGRQEVLTKHTIDPYIGSVVKSGNGPFGAKLGNELTGAQAERLVYKHQVTEPFVGFNYAVVLQDPGHSASDQPRFEVTITDAMGSAINCGTVSFVPGFNTPGFVTSNDLKYKPWSAAIFDLSSYIGQTVTFDFKTGDCAQDAHFGYAYIDGICEQVIKADEFCDGADSIILTAPPGYYKYLWSNGNTSEKAIFYKPKNGDVVSVTLTPSPGLGCPVTVPVTLKSYGLTANAGLDGTICAGEKYQLNGSISKAGTFLWTTSGSGTFDNNASLTPVYSPSIADSTAGKVKLYLKVYDALCAFTDTTLLFINAPDNPSFSYSSSTLCQSGGKQMPTITGKTGGLFSSTTGLILNSLTGEIDVASSSKGNYVVSYKTNGFCSTTGSFNVNITLARDASFSYGGPYCEKATLNPLASILPGAYSGTFSSTAGLVFIDNLTGEINLSSSTPGTYSITNTVAASGGCAVATATAPLTINPLPIITVNSETICRGASAKLIANGADSYSWSSGETTNSISVSPDTNTSYTVTGTKNSCSNTATTTITVNPNATIALRSATGTDSQTPCINTAINPIEYTISGGGTDATVSGLPAGLSGSYSGGVFTIIGTPTVKGVYSYSVNTNGTCAQTSKNGSITVNPDAVIALTSSLGTDAQELCVNTAIIPITYLVSEGGTGAFITGLPAGISGSYFNNLFTISGAPTESGIAAFNYKVSTTGNCEQTEALGSVLVNPIPAAPKASNNSPICEGAQLNLRTDTITGANYLWTGPNGFNSALQNPVLPTVIKAESGMYSVTALVNGCKSAVGTTAVLVNAIPETPILQSNSPVCEGAALYITASAISGADYLWTGPNAFNSAAQNPSILTAGASASGIYRIAATVAGCTSTDSLAVIVSYCDELTGAVNPPEGFSPNADGVNDVYLPYTKNLKSYKLFIFNRWGERIFESNNTQFGWDGMFAGTPVEQNVYVYLIQAIGNNDKVFNLSGTIILVK